MVFYVVDGGSCGGVDDHYDNDDDGQSGFDCRVWEEQARTNHKKQPY